MTAASRSRASKSACWRHMAAFKYAKRQRAAADQNPEPYQEHSDNEDARAPAEEVACPPPKVWATALMQKLLQMTLPHASGCEFAEEGEATTCQVLRHLVLSASLQPEACASGVAIPGWASSDRLQAAQYEDGHLWPHDRDGKMPRCMRCVVHEAWCISQVQQVLCCCMSRMSRNFL